MRLFVLAFIALVFLAGCLQLASSAEFEDVVGSGCCSEISNGFCNDIIPDADMGELLSSGKVEFLPSESPCWTEDAPTGEELSFCNLTFRNITSDARIYFNESVSCGQRESFVCGEGCKVVACSQELFKRLTKEPPNPITPSDLAEIEDREISEELVKKGITEALFEKVSVSKRGSAYSLLGTACSIYEISKKNFDLFSDPKTRVLSWRIGVEGVDEFKTLSNYAPLSAEQCQLNPSGFVDAVYLYNFNEPNRCRVVVYDGEELFDFAPAYEAALASGNLDEQSRILNANNTYLYRCVAGSKNAGKLFSRYIDCQLSCISPDEDPFPGDVVYPSEDVCKFRKIPGNVLASRVLDFSSGIIQVDETADATEPTPTKVKNFLITQEDFRLVKGSFDNGGYRLGALPFECVSNSECSSGICKKDGPYQRTSCVASQGVYEKAFLAEETGTDLVGFDFLASFSNLLDCGCVDGPNGETICPSNVQPYDAPFFDKSIYLAQQPKISCVKLVEEGTSDLAAFYYNITIAERAGNNQYVKGIIKGHDFDDWELDFVNLFSEASSKPSKKRYYKLDVCEATESNNVKPLSKFGVFGPEGNRMGYVAVALDDHVLNGDTPEGVEIPRNFYPIYGAPWKVGRGDFNEVTLIYTSKLTSNTFIYDFDPGIERTYPFFDSPDETPFYYPITRLLGGYYVPRQMLETTEFDTPFDDYYVESGGSKESIINGQPFTSPAYYEQTDIGCNILYENSTDVNANLLKGACTFYSIGTKILTNIFPATKSPGIIIYPNLARIEERNSESPYRFVELCGYVKIKDNDALPKDGDCPGEGKGEDLNNPDNCYFEAAKRAKDVCRENQKTPEYVVVFQDNNPRADDFFYGYAFTTSDLDWTVTSLAVLGGIKFGFMSPERLLCSDSNPFLPRSTMSKYFAELLGIDNGGYENILFEYINDYSYRASPLSSEKSSAAIEIGSACFAYNTKNIFKDWLFTPFSFTQYNANSPTKDESAIDVYGYGYYAFSYGPTEIQNLLKPLVVPIFGTSPETNLVSLLSTNGSVIDIALDPSRDFEGQGVRKRGYMPLFQQCNVDEFMPDTSYNSKWRTPKDYGGKVKDKAIYLSGLDVGPGAGADVPGLQDKLPEWLKNKLQETDQDYYVEAYYCVNPFILYAQGVAESSSISPNFPKDYYSPIRIQDAEGTIGWPQGISLADAKVRIESPCDQLSIDDYCLKKDTQGICEEFATSMLMFVYPWDAARVEVPGQGNFSTFGSCLVDEEGKLAKISVGYCEGCSVLNAVEVNEADLTNLDYPELQRFLDQGVLPIVDPSAPQLSTMADVDGGKDLRKKVRGGPTAVVAENKAEAQDLKKACPECTLVGPDPSSLVSGPEPQLPTLVYNSTAVQIGTSDLKATYDQIVSSTPATKGKAFGIPTILKADVDNSPVFQDPFNVGQFFFLYRQNLTNAGIGGLVFDVSGNLRQMTDNFCGYEKAFRSAAGREVSYVLARKQVSNSSLLEETGFQFLNKRTMNSVPSSLCISPVQMSQKGYSVVCYSKDLQGDIVVKTISPFDVGARLSDPLLYDVYAPIVASVGRSSGIYLCNEEDGNFTYTYDLVPQADFLGEAPVLIPNQQKMDSYFSGNEEAACFREPLTQSALLRATGQSLDNLNCYVLDKCCKTTLDSTGNPGKEECEAQRGWWDEDNGICFKTRIPLPNAYDSYDYFHSIPKYSQQQLCSRAGGTYYGGTCYRNVEDDERYICGRVDLSMFDSSCVDPEDFYYTELGHEDPQDTAAALLFGGALGFIGAIGLTDFDLSPTFSNSAGLLCEEAFNTIYYSTETQKCYDESKTYPDLCSSSGYSYSPLLEYCVKRYFPLILINYENLCEEKGGEMINGMCWLGGKTFSSACNALPNSFLYELGETGSKICFTNTKTFQQACSQGYGGVYAGGACYYSPINSIRNLCESIKITVEAGTADGETQQITISAFYAPNGYCYVNPRDAQDICLNGLNADSTKGNLEAWNEVRVCYDKDKFDTAVDLLCSFTNCPSYTPPPGEAPETGLVSGEEGQPTTPPTEVTPPGIEGQPDVRYEPPTPGVE